MPSNSPSKKIMFGNAQDAVVDAIRNNILNGHYQPGDRLRQDDLARALGVSTMPIREALRTLQAEGLVTFHANRGASVSEVSVEEYQEIYRIREELEVLACTWTAQNFDAVPIARLEELLNAIETAEEDFNDTTTRLKLVREFSFTVLEVSSKEHLIRILSSLWDLSHQYQLHFSTLKDLIPQRLENYQRVYEACVAKDSDALVAAYRAMYRFGRENLIPQIPKKDITDH